MATQRGVFISHRSRSEATKLSYKQGNRQPDNWTQERRAALSLRQSSNNSGGRCKWYEVAGRRVQGTWERDFALELEKRQIKWRKPRIHSEVLKYTLDGIERSYTPDFYLLEFNFYVEVKGYWWGNDKAKMNAVIEQHPSTKILIVEKQMFEDFMQGKQIW